MESNVKHYKFINSQTDNVIYYHTIAASEDKQALKRELDRVKTEVAVKNGLYVGLVYWEELPVEVKP